MSSAIEVIKEMIGDYKLLGLTARINNKKKLYDADVKRINALKEALLALEQKNKTIKKVEGLQEYYECNPHSDKGDKLSDEAREEALKILNEILKELNRGVKTDD